MYEVYYPKLTVRPVEKLFLWAGGEPDRLLEAGLIGFVDQREFPQRPHAPERFEQDLQAKKVVQVRFEGAQEWIAVPAWSLEVISGIISDK